MPPHVSGVGAERAPEEVLEEAFQMTAAFHGFDIQGFDAFLATFPESSGRTQLVDRRKEAKKALFGDGSNEVRKERMLRHLEWMLLRWEVCVRDSSVMPLARIGAKVKQGGRKGQARNNNSKADVICQAAADEGHIDSNAISRIAKKVGATNRTVRDHLVKAGRYTPRGKGK